MGAEKGGPLSLAVITGASSGLGLSLCRVFLKQGWRVVAVSRRGTSLPGARNHAADLSQPSDLDRFLRETSDIGPVDLLINNAGTAPAARLPNASEESFDRAIALNFTAPRLLINGFKARLPGGTVVNILSRVGFEGRIGLSGYATSKGLLAGLTAGLAREFSPGIRFFGINPGFMVTGMTNDVAVRTQRRESVLSLTPGPENSAHAIHALVTRPGYLGLFIDLDSRVYRSWKPWS